MNFTVSYLRLVTVATLALIYSLTSGCARQPATVPAQVLAGSHYDSGELNGKNLKGRAGLRSVDTNDVWVRVDDAFAGAIIEFSDAGDGTKNATLVYTPPEMVRWGWHPGELKIKGLAKAGDHLECESLVKTFDQQRNMVLDEWYEPEVVYVHVDNELVFRQKQGRDAVVGEWQRWLRLDKRSSHFANYLFGKAMVAENHRQASLAVQYYRRALRVAPKDPRILNAFSWYLAVNPRGQDSDARTAVDLAVRACELTNFLEPMYVDTLAAAHAANGDFKSAVKFQRDACKMIDDAEFRARLTLYRMNRPFIEGMNVAGVPSTPLGKATGASPLDVP